MSRIERKLVRVAEAGSDNDGWSSARCELEEVWIEDEEREEIVNGVVPLRLGTRRRYFRITLTNGQQLELAADAAVAFYELRPVAEEEA